MKKFIVLLGIFLLSCSSHIRDNPYDEFGVDYTIAAPLLSSPANGTTGQNTSLKLTWDSVIDAAMYEVQVSTDSAFSTITFVDSMISGDSTVIGDLSTNTVYYWRLQARNSAHTSAWSGTWSFTTAAPNPSLSAPVQSLPTNGAIGQETSLTLTWGAVTNATSYSVQVSTVSTFLSWFSSQTGLTVTTASVSGLAAGTTYYWQVNAENQNGASAWSSAWSFTTIIAPPGPPILSSPANNAADQSVTPTLSWIPGSGGSVTSYDVQVSTSENFGTLFYAQNGLSMANLTLSSLLNGATYYWRVNASGPGGTGAWSGAWSFTTTIIAPPTPPTPASPANGSTNQATSLTLNWGAVTNAASYTIQVSTVSTFSTTFSSQTGITAISASLSGLAASTTYYWRVNATNAGGSSAWSGAWSFATSAPPPPGPPILSSPANNATGQSVTPTLSWSPGSGGTATSYEVQVSTSASFETLVYQQSGLAMTNTTLSGLANNTTYYWEVNATGPGGISAWSGDWDFTTLTPTVMRLISGGTFQMGSTNTNFPDEQPVHSVTVSSFYMDTTDVTQSDYQMLMGVNPSHFLGNGRNPVDSETWFDAVLYCNARSKHDGYDSIYSYTSITGTPGNGCTNLGNLVIDFTQHGYRLPTEAEWEYACRAGTTTDFYWGQSYPPITTADTTEISTHAWWYYNSSTGTQPVATKPANGWGLYDLSGNVQEWCNDWFGSYNSGSQTDPTGVTSGTYRVFRGGSWNDVNLDSGLRSAFRNTYYEGVVPDNRYCIGFRCVRR